MKADRADRRAALLGARLLVIVGSSARGREAEAVVRACISGGARFFELRVKERTAREVHALAERLARVCGDAGALLVVNDDAAVALASGADGVHVGEDDLPPEACRKVVGEDLLVGLSVHGPAEAARAVAARVDYVGIGTVYESALKPDLPARGTGRLSSLLGGLGGIPGYAIGGIRLDNLGPVLGTGVHGVAVGSAICEADDVEAAARAFVRALACERGHRG